MAKGMNLASPSASARSSGETPFSVLSRDHRAISPGVPGAMRLRKFSATSSAVRAVFQSRTSVIAPARIPFAPSHTLLPRYAGPFVVSTPNPIGDGFAATSRPLKYSRIPPRPETSARWNHSFV